MDLMTPLLFCALAILAPDTLSETASPSDTMLVTVQDSRFPRKSFDLKINGSNYSADTLAGQAHKWWIDISDRKTEDYRNWIITLSEEITKSFRIDSSLNRKFGPSRKCPSKLDLNLAFIEPPKVIKVQAHPIQVTFRYGENHYQTDMEIPIKEDTSKEIQVLFQITTKVATSLDAVDFPLFAKNIFKRDLVTGKTVEWLYSLSCDRNKSRVVNKDLFNQAVQEYCIERDPNSPNGALVQHCTLMLKKSKFGSTLNDSILQANDNYIKIIGDM